MLRVWRHPKTLAIRLYFSKKIIRKALDDSDSALSPDDVKGWVQDRGGRPEVCVTVKQEGSGDPKLTSDIRGALEKCAGLTPTDTWASILEAAESAGNEKAEEPENHEANNQDSADEDLAPSKAEIARNKKRNGEASRLKIETIKMHHPIIIEIDHRETKLITELIDVHPMVTVKVVALQLADFRVTDREGNELLIERKRCTGEHTKTDFEASIQDNRLFSQAERLKFQVANSDHEVVPIILLEGRLHDNAVSMLLQQVDGALSYLAAVQRISILHSYNATHSAYVIVMLASHFSDGLYKKPSAHKSKPKALWQQKSYVLESLPGISTQIAEALLERFHSVRAVVNASEGDLSRVKGIGPKRSREIHRVLGEL